MRTALPTPLALALLLLVTAAGPALATTGAGAPGGGPDDFRVTLDVTAGAARDFVGVGMAPAATGGYDTGLDRAEPPAPPIDRWVQAYVFDANASSSSFRRLNNSILAPASTAEWVVRLDGEGSGSQVTLAWTSTEITVLGSGLRLELVDGATRTDMGAVTSYSFTPAAGLWTRTLTIVLSPAASGSGTGGSTGGGSTGGTSGDSTGGSTGGSTGTGSTGGSTSDSTGTGSTGGSTGTSTSGNTTTTGGNSTGNTTASEGSAGTGGAPAGNATDEAQEPADSTQPPANATGGAGNEAQPSAQVPPTSPTGATPTPANSTNRPELVPTPTPTPTSKRGGIPGFEIVFVLSAVAVAAFAARRSQYR